MKNKKFKLFASLTSLVMVVAVMAVGVWAATNAKVTATGTASFSVAGIAAEVKVAASGSDIGTANDTILSTTVAGDNNTTAEWEFSISYTPGDVVGNGTLLGVQKVLKITITPAATTAPVFYQIAAATGFDYATKDGAVEIKDIYTTQANAEGEEETTLTSTEGITSETTITIVFEVVKHQGNVALNASNAVVQGFSIELKNAGF